MGAKRERLNRQRVAARALELIERDGLEAFSLRRLGAELGVEAMALYKHYPSRAALLDAAVGTVLAELGPPVAGDGPWQDQVREWGRSVRELALRHPQVFPLLATSGAGTPALRPYLQAVATVLEGAGFSDERLVDAMRAIFGFVIGFVLWDLKDEGLPGAGPRPPGHRLDRRSFEFGLDVVVAGLEAAR